MKRRHLILFPLFLLLASALSTRANAAVTSEYVLLVGGPSLQQWEKYKAQPHDHWWANFVHAARLRTDQLRAQLVGAQAGGMHKVGPPMIVRLCFIFFPLLERWSADEQDIFASNSSVRSGGECRSEQEKKWKKDQVTSFHQELWEHYLC